MAFTVSTNNKGIRFVIDKVNERLAETKNPCKNYAKEGTAIATAEKYAKRYGEYFLRDKKQLTYYVIFIEAWERYVIAFDLSSHTSSPNFMGGYVAMPSSEGFFTI